MSDRSADGYNAREHARATIQAIDGHINEKFLTVGARWLLLDAKEALARLLNAEAQS